MEMLVQFRRSPKMNSMRQEFALSFGLLFSCACWCGNVATLALRIIIPTASVCKVDVLTRAAARRMFVDTAAILFRG